MSMNDLYQKNESERLIQKKILDDHKIPKISKQLSNQKNILPNKNKTISKAQIRK